jgi:hypothetical protein
MQAKKTRILGKGIESSVSSDMLSSGLYNCNPPVRMGRTATPNCDRLISVEMKKTCIDVGIYKKRETYKVTTYTQDQKSSNIRADDDATGIVDPSPVATEEEPTHVRRRPKISRAVFP